MLNHHTPETAVSSQCTDIERFLRILHPDGVYEIRVIDCPDRQGSLYRSTASGYFTDAKTAADWVTRFEGLEPPAVYVSLNPVAESLLARAANRIIHRSRKTTSKADVIGRRWLFIDIDAKRTSGVSSTDDELAAAMSLSDTLLDALREAGWPEPLRGMSGNGAYLFWRINLSNDEEAEALIKGVLGALAERYNTTGAEVDLSPHDANRICKVLGTMARKGDALVGVPGVVDRPHRRSWFIDPAGELQVVSIELLRELAGAASEVSVATAPAPSRSGSVGSMSEVERAERYLSKMEPSVDGHLGSRRLYAAACVVLHKFGLSHADGLAVLSKAFNPRCEPPWDVRGLERALRKARAEDSSSQAIVSSAGAAGDRPGRIRGSQATLAADAPWDEPVPIDRHEVPPFPVAVLPEPLRTFVAAAAEATQTPPDLAGLLALAACSGAVARRFEVFASRSWTEPVNLYVACLLEPANRKSAVFRLAMAPLRSIESELIAAAAPSVARAQAERRVRETQAKALEAKAAKGDNAAQAEALQLAEELAAEPRLAMPKLLVDDATAEAIEITLEAQGGRLVVAGAEAGVFDVMGGRYSSGIGNLDVFLKGHACEDLRVDRVTRGSLSIDRCCLTLAYAVQPEVIRGMANKPTFRGRGLIGRFFYAVPKTTLGRRLPDPEPVPVAVLGAYDHLVRRLAALPDRDDGPWLLQLSPQASERFLEWVAEVEVMLADDGRLASMRDWAGKLCGLTARLAGVLHLVQTDAMDVSAVPIGVDTIRSAIALGRWAIPHAEAVIHMMAGGDGSLDDAAYVLRWLYERGEAQVTRRDVHAHGRSRFDDDKERLDRALDVLVERGWLRQVEDGARRPGRPSVRYSVHPRVVAGGHSSIPIRPVGDLTAIEQPGRVRGVI